MKIVQKKEQNISFVIRRKVPYAFTEKMTKDFIKQKEIIALFQSFENQSYSKDELIDLLTKNTKSLHNFIQRRTRTVWDTAAVRSRLTLVEVNMKRLGFLLQKKHTQPDSIQASFSTFINSLNAVIQQVNLHQQSTDEFKDILLHDSITQAHHDSIMIDKHKPVHINKANIKIPDRIKNRLKQHR